LQIPRARKTITYAAGRGRGALGSDRANEGNPQNANGREPHDGILGWGG
jgi:hypothetical protein